MSWTDFYPVFDKLYLSEFELLATLAEWAELEEWCTVTRRINERPVRHRVAVSLFWKNLRAEEGDLAVTGREQMKDAGKLGLISRYAPWEHYVEPLLQGAALLRAAGLGMWRVPYFSMGPGTSITWVTIGRSMPANSARGAASRWDC